MTEVKSKNSHYGVKDNGRIDISVKDIDTVSRTVCLVGNTYLYKDSDNDILMPGCAAKSIKERGVDSKSPDKIVHALFHDLTRLPGKPQLIEEREIKGMKCLYMESKLTDTTDGLDTLKNYAAGIYNQHSIGFQYVKYKYIRRGVDSDKKDWDNLMAECINPKDCNDVDGVFRVDEIKLFEISTVAFGANRLTPTLGMKSVNKEAVALEYLQRIDLFEKTLKSGTQSDEMMYTLSLQLLQMKQAFSEIMQHFEKKDARQMTEAVPPTEPSFLSRIGSRF